MILSQTHLDVFVKSKFMEGFAKNWQKSERQPKEDIQPGFE